MTLTQVEQAVLVKARAEAESLLEESRRSVQARLDGETARLREEHTRRVESLRAELAGAHEREIGAREAEARLKLLRQKNEIIEAIFQQAVQAALNLPNQGYRRWLQAQLAQLPAAGGEIVANSRDRQMIADLLRESGRSGYSVAADAVPIQGGFIVRGKESDLDYSVESLVGVLRESIADTVVNQLFA